MTTYTNYEEWMEAVKKAHPKEAPKMQFKGRVEKGHETISAEVRGIDKCFGVWTPKGDGEDGEGTVLTASAVATILSRLTETARPVQNNERPDFYSLLVKQFPEEFKETPGPHFRGTYEGHMELSVVKMIDPQFPGLQMYTFTLLAGSVVEDLQKAHADFQNDVQFCCYKLGYAIALGKTAKDVKNPGTYKLMQDRKKNYLLVVCCA